MEETSTHIDNLFQYCQRHLQLIDQYGPASEDVDIHRRILYINIIDALSRTIGVEKTNRKRFVSFVRKFCEWENCDRISLPHLAHILRYIDDESLDPLKNFVINRMSNWMAGECVKLSKDSELSEILELWPHHCEFPQKIKGKFPSHFQHVHLLYTFRNSLVHEFRLPGIDFNMWNTDEPYYIHFNKFGGEEREFDESSWQLQFPVKFVRRLCQISMRNLEDFLRDNNIDPIIAFRSSTYWISLDEP